MGKIDTNWGVLIPGPHNPRSQVGHGGSSREGRAPDNVHSVRVPKCQYIEMALLSHQISKRSPSRTSGLASRVLPCKAGMPEVESD